MNKSEELKDTALEEVTGGTTYDGSGKTVPLDIHSDGNDNPRTDPIGHHEFEFGTTPLRNTDEK